MASRIFPIKTKPSKVCQTMAIDKGARVNSLRDCNRNRVILGKPRKVYAKHAKGCPARNTRLPTDAQIYNSWHHKLGEGMTRFEAPRLASPYDA